MAKLYQAPMPDRLLNAHLSETKERLNLVEDHLPMSPLELAMAIQAAHRFQCDYGSVCKASLSPARMKPPQ